MIPVSSTHPIDPTAVLELHQVDFRRGQVQILQQISVTVRPGEHWALLGPNGAGKSTILGMCGAQTHPSSGTVDVLGQRLGRVELAALRKQIGHVDPRHRLRSALTVREVLLTGLTGTIEPPMRWTPTVEDLALVAELAEQVGMAAKLDREWPLLSQGERGRTLIGRALACRPELLLLDEPTTGLDMASREQLLETIDDLSHSDPQLASVLVTHHVEELPESTTHAVLLAGGRTVGQGLIEQVLTTAAVSAAFGHPIQIGRVGRRWTAHAVRVQPATQH